MKALILYLLIFTFPCLGGASYDEILDIAGKYNKQKKEVLNFEKERRNLLSKIYELEKETSKLVRDKGQFSRDQIAIDDDVKRVSRSIVILEGELKEMTKQIMDRWVQIQKIQDMPWMYVLLSSYSPSELERVLKTLETINRGEAQVIKSYMEKFVELDSEKKKLHQLAKNLLKANRGFLSKEKEISNQHRKRKELLGQLNKKIKKTKKNIRKTQHLGRKIADQQSFGDLKLLFVSSFFEKKGQLPHPFKGPIQHSYGLNQILLRDNIKLLHKGLFYGLSKDTKVRAVGLGRVKYAKKISSQGYTVIVDHGSHYYSVYSHLKQVRVKKGDLVEPKDTLGQLGAYNAQFGQGLYFEIRHFSEPENPEKWLKTKVNSDKLAKI